MTSESKLDLAERASTETMHEYLVTRPSLMLTFLDIAERYAKEVRR